MVSSKVRYALLAICELGDHTRPRQSAAEIARCLAAPLPFIGQILHTLRTANLLTVVRGRAGGYELARPASDITLADVFEGVGERLDTTRCGGKEDCIGGRRCRAHHALQSLNVLVQNHLQTVTIADLQLSGDESVITRVSATP